MLRAGSRLVALASALLLTMGLLLSVTPAAAQPGTMCEVITIAELDGLSPLAYDSATADFTGCAYAPADAAHSLRIGLAPLGEVKSMPEVFPGGVETLVGDSSKFREETGWEPLVPWEQTLRDLLEYWRENIASESPGR